MPELRQDLTTKEWIIIATDRAKRPQDFKRQAVKKVLLPYDDTCPFCPGHEAETPPEVLAYREDEGADARGWTVRVIPNKFSALVPQGSTERRANGNVFRVMDGVGYHEVIVETPIHNRFVPLMEEGEVERILQAYRDRYLALRQDRRVKLILIFKNHGETAGTSLSHPHSQLVATPVVPAFIRRKYQEAVRYYDVTGRCLYSDLVEAERMAGERIVLETQGFVVFHPFASQSPFETWIVPTRRCPCFAHISMEEVRELAGVLKWTLGRLAVALNDPDYNYVLHTVPVDGEDEEYYLWHIQIVPRLSAIAGFEIGSGMRINTARPEETARFLRQDLTTT
ncbi:MAG: galactose-1-phosphate uridylyltransferase [Candidatus Methylomirabilia bacterium]